MLVDNRVSSAYPRISYRMLADSVDKENVKIINAPRPLQTGDLLEI